LVGSEIERPLIVQSPEVAEDVICDLLWLSLRVDPLQFGDDFVNGVRAVATLDNLKAWAVQSKRPFWHMQNTGLLPLLIEAATDG
jgi:hypothetical protein